MKKKAPQVDSNEITPLLIGVWRRFHKLSGPADKLQTREFRTVVEAVQKMQKGFDHETDYFKDKDLLGAYLLYYWMIHYQQGLSLINELPITPRRVLDLCSGPAPMAFAALRHGASDVTAIDRNQTALQLGAEVCGRYGLPLAVRQADCTRGPLPVEGKFDLIIASHCMEELFPAAQKDWQGRQKAFVNGLLGRLTSNGFLLLVESSLNESNRRILMLRDQLVQEGVPVQAPCVWRGECPALKAQNSPCYAQRELDKTYLIKEIQRAAQINQNSLKMTYLIFKSPHAHWPQLPDRSLYRIISPPVDSYQGKRYYLCGTEGKKNLGSHLTDHPVDSRAFDYLRRGELISVKGALVKENSYDIVQDTKLTIEAAVGKPIPEISLPDEF